MKEGRSKVVFKRLIRHKGFLKIHLEHRPTNVMQILGSWPSGSFCLTTKRTLILIFFWLVLWIHICWLKTTFCCLNPFFNWVILVFGGGFSRFLSGWCTLQILRLRVAICNEILIQTELLRISHDEQRSLGIWLACINGFGRSH